MTDKLTLSVPEAANLLGISRDLCGDMIRAGKIPHIRWGARVLVPRVALEKRVAELAEQSIRPDRLEAPPAPKETGP